MQVEQNAGIDQNIPAETDSNSNPTTLQLFSYRGIGLQRTRACFNGGVQFRSEFISANSALGRLSKETLARVKRIKEASTEFTEALIDQRSYRAAGMAYLKMADEFSDRGLASGEIMDFYSRCLRINTSLYTYSFQLQKEVGIGKLVADSLIGNRGKLSNHLTTVVNQEVETPPAWFRGNKNEWRQFVEAHCFFVSYLYPGFAGQNRYPTPEENEKYPYQTLERALPDWLPENKDTLPDRKTVEKELEEECRESVRITAQLVKMVSNQKYLLNVQNEKGLRATLRFEERRRGLLNAVAGFTDAIIFLGSTETMAEYAVDPVMAPKMTADQVRSTFIPSERSRVRALAKIAQSDNVILSKEAVALWIESQLRGGGIIASAQDMLDQGFINVFEAVLDQAGQPEKKAEELLADLKVGNKKAFKALNYELLPLLMLMSADEKAYINELIQACRGDAIEPIVWEMAEILSPKLIGVKKDALPNQSAIVVNRLKEFSTKWIRNNWQWAWAQLEKVASTDLHPEPITGVRPATSEAFCSEFTTSTADDEEAEDIETLIEDVQRGNLNGWHLYYTFNRRVDDSSLVEIAGATEEEKEAEFRQFVAGNRISCSIKPESVIRTFEWLVAVPQYVENIRMRKEIKGEVFKKIKRGPIRIFYTMDSNQKNIIFFIHQKKADDYGF